MGAKAPERPPVGLGPAIPSPPPPPKKNTGNSTACHIAEARRVYEEAKRNANMPRRRVECTIKIGADSIADLLRSLNEICDAISEGRGQNGGPCVTGGCSAGYSFEVNEDETITHDSYFQAIEEWRATKEDAKR